MNGDVEITVSGTTADRLPPTLLTLIDMLADALYVTAGWQLRVTIDPGTVIVATPARDTTPPETPAEAPLAPEDGEDG